jgi:hypothetical protein
LDAKFRKFMNSSCRIDVITRGGYLNKLASGNFSDKFVNGLLDMVAFHADSFHSKEIADSFFDEYYEKKVNICDLILGFFRIYSGYFLFVS